MGETPDASPSNFVANNSNKAKKKSQKRNSGKSKRKDKLKSEAVANGVGQVQFIYLLHCCVTTSL